MGQPPDLTNVASHTCPTSHPSEMQAEKHWSASWHQEEPTRSILSDDDSYLETLSYWLELGSSVTWNTLLDVLGHFETKHTVDELTDKIVSDCLSLEEVTR